MKSFQDFRSEISIIEIAASIGYLQDKQKGNKWPVLVNHFTKEKIIIVNPSSRSNQGYFNPNDDTDKGTLIDFIRVRLGQDFAKASTLNEVQNINKVLYGFQNIDIPHFPDFVLKKSNYQFFKNDFLPLKNRDYLDERGIKNTTLDLQEFNGTILEQLRNGFTNISFPYKNAEGKIMGGEFRNQQYKIFSTGMDRSNVVWHSNMPQKLDSIALAESPIDAISYHQLKKPKNVLYIAFGGAITDSQITLVKQLQSTHKNLTKNFHFLSIMDNDLQGKKYNEKLAESLKHNLFKVDCPIGKDFNEDLRSGMKCVQGRKYCIQ